ncbi:MAG TPA: FHA domain-containing protein [Thermoanaerobaculia bacterium]|nr:FHA domain-containing protein [Thermoanaerobaculia bacterium]
MQVILQGSLRHFAADELLSLFGTNRHTGTLDVESKGRRTRVVFREGLVSWAISMEPSLEMTSILATYGLLTKEQLDELQAKGLREALASNIVTEQHLRFCVSEVVLDLFSWINGTFTFIADARIPEGMADVALDWEPLVEDGRQRSADVHRVLKLYPDDQIVLRVVDDPGVHDKISLSSEEFKVLFRIGTGRTLAQLCTDLGRAPIDVYPLVHTLEMNGLITASDGEPVTMVQSDQTVLSKPIVLDPTPTPRPRTSERKRTLVGSLTPDGFGGSVYPLLETDYTIGRDPSNGIPIPDGSVSSKHARVFRTPEGFVIEDLKSRNGTFVNGEKVTEKRLLTDNDLIRVGKVILTFNIAKEQRASPDTQPEIRVP